MITSLGYRWDIFKDVSFLNRDEMKNAFAAGEGCTVDACKNGCETSCETSCATCGSGCSNGPDSNG